MPVATLGGTLWRKGSGVLQLPRLLERTLRGERIAEVQTTGEEAQASFAWECHQLVMHDCLQNWCSMMKGEE